MNPPIIIVENNDITIHPTVEHTEGYLEVQDVKDNIDIAYDSEGQLLNLFVDFVERERNFLWLKWIKQYETVIIKEYEPQRYNLPDLRVRLINSLKTKKFSDEELKNRSIKELVGKVGKKNAVASIAKLRLDVKILQMYSFVPNLKDVKFEHLQ